MNAIDTKELVKKTKYNAKIKEIEEKIFDHDYYITTP